MRARRVGIMLALAALSATVLFVALLLAGEAQASIAAGPSPVAGTAADTLAGYRDELAVDAGGDATVSVTVVLGRVSSMDLLLPWQAAGGRDHQIVRGPAEFAVGPDSLPLPVATVAGLPHWNLRLLPGAAPGDTIILSAVVPAWYDEKGTRGQFGVHELRRQWVNSSRFVLADFRLGLVLPPGQLVETVGATTPAFDSNKNPRPPFTIGRDGDRGTFEIAVASLPPTATAAFRLEARPVRRGQLPLLLGGTLAVLYLVFNRGLLDAAARR